MSSSKKKGFAELLPSKTRKRVSIEAAADEGATTEGASIEGAGRVLSARNESALREAIEAIDTGRETIVRVLETAGVLATGGKEGEGKEGEGDESSSNVSAAAIEAGVYLEEAEKTGWYLDLEVTLSVLSGRFGALHCNSLELLEEDIESEADRLAEIELFLKDIRKVLEGLADSRPKPRESYIKRNPSWQRSYGKNQGPEYYPDFYASADSSRYEAVEASKNYSFALDIAKSSWKKKLNLFIDAFRWRFSDICVCSLPSFDIKTEDDRQKKLKEIVSELVLVLKKLSKSYPFEGKISASSQQQGRSEGDFEEGREIKAARVSISFGNLQLNPDLDIDENLIPSEIQASNAHAVEGSLFRVDEVSESPPSVGPGLPLFISREVAENCLNVANLPLEASSNLSVHDKEGTIGVMSSACIDGNDFRINGVLWPWNHSTKVQAIKAESKSGTLGMSMNANADGHIAVVPCGSGQQKVFVIDRLELLGGCILYSDLATWQKTSLAASGHEFNRADSSDDCSGDIDDEEVLRPIAAASGSSTDMDKDSSKETGSEMTTNNFDTTITRLATVFDESMQTIDDRMDQMAATISALSSTVASLNNAHQQTVQAQRQTEEAQRSENQGKELATSIAAALKEVLPGMVQEQVNQIMAGRRQPPRVASSSPSPEHIAPVLDNVQPMQVSAASARLDVLRGQLQVLRETNGDRKKRLSLTDEIRQLESQMAVSGF